MVVEDEHIVALDLLERLERMGHEPIVAHGGEEAVDKALTTSLDVVLMDIKLQGQIDGIEAAQIIRDLCDVPIIYVTAYADNRTLERARATEPYAYVLKPFQERELKAAVEITLQRHQSERERQRRQQVLAFLSDATARMAATLDYQQVAASALESLVPRQADWCMLNLEARGDLASTTVTRPEGPTLRGDPGTPALAASVIRDARPELLDAIPDDAVLRRAVAEPHLDHVRALGAHSLICVPVFIRDQVIGALTLIAGHDRRPYAMDDLLAIEDFGHRLAISLENALLYRKSEAAIRMRDDVLAVVSHDLRTPLGSILMHVDALLQDPDHARVGSAIAHLAQRMNRLIGDLLDASAVNAGHLSLDVQQHLACGIASEAVEMFRTQAQARDIELVADCPDRSVRVSCDGDRIMQVLSNLLDNAFKFTGRGGQVVVAARVQPAGVRFEVRDTGRGIPEDQLPRLFDRFWRAQAHRQGAGLGLFISRGIVAAHGGELTVASRPGAGSSFSFTLPRVA